MQWLARNYFMVLWENKYTAHSWNKGTAETILNFVVGTFLLYWNCFALSRTWFQIIISVGCKTFTIIHCIFCYISYFSDIENFIFSFSYFRAHNIFICTHIALLPDNRNFNNFSCFLASVEYFWHYQIYFLSQALLSGKFSFFVLSSRFIIW